VKIVKLKILLFIFTLAIAGCSTKPTGADQKFGFRLPPRARYTVTDQQFEAATLLLQKKLVPDTNQLKTIISAPCLCGPGLWHLIKDSPHFSVPLHAKASVIHPITGGPKQEFPIGLLQDENEATDFRAALADLLSMDGELKFRLPNEDEFTKFWSVTPFNRISEPLIVAEGERFNFVIEFAKGRPFWIDEAKSMTLKRVR
jgi:hypothetical protein